MPLSAPRRIGTPLETLPPAPLPPPPPPAPPPPLETGVGGAGGGGGGCGGAGGDDDVSRLQGGQGGVGGVGGVGGDGCVATHAGADVPKLRAELDLLREMCAQCAVQQRGLEEQTRREAQLLCASFNHAR